MQGLNKKNFNIAVTLSLVIAIALLFTSILAGKQELFLLLNGDAGHAADIFFMVWTYGGDGLMWIIVLLKTLLWLKRKDALMLLINTFAISTILTQVIKNFIASGTLRPIKAIANTSLIHIVPGVELHTISSFPSGHTATAFSIYLFFCLLLQNKWWLWVGLLYAVLVGYSRIYLAQHFPLDVGAGIIIAIISVWLSLKIQEYWWKRKMTNKIR